MHPRKLFVQLSLVLLVGAAATQLAFADTTNGTLSADNSVYTYSFNTASNSNYTFSTSSYATGGFVPVLTLFDSTGAVVGFDGADGVCNASETADSTTGMCDDAFFMETLGPGSYTLDLTEFPNFAVGPDLADGFEFENDPTATGDVCGVSGMFLEADTGTCVQRTDAFALSVNNTSPVPEPPTSLMVLSAFALISLVKYRHLA